ncbi:MULTISPECIES: GNAT family N-acetyltransferase [Pseudoalteromonas]|uniref:GNAT family N-acetyltransferase n=1 Tax=Pseudoalteromonas amylolytica TaxID=1859457 RepID=A0A1S1MXD8_9GAMM|nr:MULTISPECIES: GNAT family protein [Pseudoalteromonas]OHU90206.1 GNAT family N-acetyltransferase [Pseudoalteromonas sp. JW3]OHU92427.1 GNAT family N-acetyltransferase [Pseudoalteromonas amylolytica]
MWIKNVPLVGRWVTLIPLAMGHSEALKNAVQDGESWRLWYANVPKPEQMDDYVADAIVGAEQGNVAYAVINNQSQQIVGTTRYYQVDGDNRRAAIGYTWYANSARRTAINTEAKLLLLENLFGQCNAVAVEFRTHFLNHTSRGAIERLGAKLDGILRAHQIMRDGSLRDTAVYSIVASEWPAVRNNLKYKLSSRM